MKRTVNREAFMPLTPADYGFEVVQGPSNLTIRWRSDASGPVYRALTLGMSRNRQHEVTIADGRLQIAKDSWALDELSDLRIEDQHLPIQNADPFVLKLKKIYTAEADWALLVNRGPRKIVVATQLSEARARYLGQILLEHLPCES